MSHFPTVIISGPVQCGKTAVLLRIKQLLEQEFGAQVYIDPTKVLVDTISQEMDKDRVRDSTWTLIEVNTRG